MEHEKLEDFERKWKMEILEHPNEYPNLFELEVKKNNWNFKRW